MTPKKRIFWLSYILIVVLAVSLLNEAKGGKTVNGKGSIRKEEATYIDIYITNYSYHSSLVIPIKSEIHNWEPLFSPHFITYKYLEISWGDREYYMASRFDIKKGLRALLLPTSSVVHVVSFPQEPHEFLLLEEIGKISLTRKNFSKLLKYIKESFLLGKKNQLIYLKDGLYGASGFFASPKIYHGLFNCNNWVFKALNKAGISTPIWGGFPVDVTPFKE